MFHLKLAISLLFINFARNSVIRKNEEQAASLYNDQDKVAVLNADNFYQFVYDQQRASNVEFYNSFCGFCRRFAPIYKQFAADIYGWRDIVQVAAIDCADDANNDLCRYFEIMSYPTLRYFPPSYKNETRNWGINIEHPPMQVGLASLIELMANTTDAPKHWPNLQPLQRKSRDELFERLPSCVKYVFLLYEPNNHTTTAQEVALDLHKMCEVSVRQVASISIGVNLGLLTQPGLYVGDRNTRMVETIPIEISKISRVSVRDTIVNYLTTKGIQVRTTDEQLQSPEENSPSSSQASSTANSLNEKDAKIIDYIKKTRGVVFQADLENALRSSVFHELVKYNDMNVEQIDAVKRYVSLLQKYSPLGDNGNNFLTELNKYVADKTNLNGKQLSDKIKELESKYKPIFSSTNWIGCKASISNRRGFSCGLWTLFHYLTVQASISERTKDPSEVLQAIYGFVKHFFGCTHCSLHFQEMAQRRNMWSVTTKDDAVLWLWSAHNEVNQRLAGDETEDPAFPKERFPSRELCPECYQPIIQVESSTSTGTDATTYQWNRNEVLYFLRRTYSPFNLSRYGVDDESVLPEMFRGVDANRISGARRSYTSAFSDIDIRMGILLYAFCMLIIVIAVKLFLQRGYRKKIYTHDYLGKI